MYEKQSWRWVFPNQSFVYWLLQPVTGITIYEWCKDNRFYHSHAVATTSRSRSVSKHELGFNNIKVLLHNSTAGASLFGIDISTQYILFAGSSSFLTLEAKNDDFEMYISMSDCRSRNLFHAKVIVRSNEPPDDDKTMFWNWENSIGIEETNWASFWANFG